MRFRRKTSDQLNDDALARRLHVEELKPHPLLVEYDRAKLALAKAIERASVPQERGGVGPPIPEHMQREGVGGMPGPRFEHPDLQRPQGYGDVIERTPDGLRYTQPPPEPEPGLDDPRPSLRKLGASEVPPERKREWIEEQALMKYEARQRERRRERGEPEPGSSEETRALARIDELRWDDLELLPAGAHPDVRGQTYRRTHPGDHDLQRRRSNALRHARKFMGGGRPWVRRRYQPHPMRGGN